MKTIEYATENKEEVQLISQILNDYSEESYQNYADWLSGVDNESAEYIRQIGAGEKTGNVPTHRSNSWLQLFGRDQCWMKLQSEASNELKEAIHQWVEPIVILTPEPTADDKIPIGASKFRGYPDLPASVEWPTCEFERIHFQVQINLADLEFSQAAERYNLPSKGLLLLFAFEGDGIQPGVVDDDRKEIPDLACLIYIADTSDLIRHIRPHTSHGIHGEYSCSLSFREALDLPWSFDAEDTRLRNQDNVDDFHGYSEVGWVSKMFGYPMHRCTFSTTSPGPEWMNLFTLGCNEREPNWSWCDGENLDVYVPEISIRSASFTPYYAYAG